MVDIYLEYQGDLHCRAEHGPSSAVLVTDAPVDNQGRGESFSPTDLVATGLGTCMATVMGILARQRGYALEGTRVHVKKQMTTSAPRRIATLAVDVTLPKSATVSVADGRADLEHAASTCPVRLSLLDAIDVPVAFEWQS
jgi:putative redox protein